MSENIYGIHAVNSILANSPERLIEVFVLKGREDKRLQPLLNELYALGIAVQFVNRQTLDKKSNGEVHQGVIARVQEAKELNEHDLDELLTRKQNPLLLVLDGVTDPHNLGACLRTADAAGVSAVIVPKDKSAQLTSIARKVACGAAETVPLIRVTNLARTLRDLQQNHNIWVVGTAGEATETIYQSKLTGSLALVMGAEGEGMRRLTREHCDQLISIPMAGSVSSLPFVQQAVEEMTRVMPADQVICGIPFYTRVWTEKFGQSAITSEVLGMDGAKNYAKENQMTETWDASLGQNVATVETSDARYTIWMEDEQSMEEKLKVIQSADLAGVAEWKLGFERADIWSLISEYIETNS